MSSLKNVLFNTLSALLMFISLTAAADKVLIPSDVYLAPESGPIRAGHGSVNSIIDGSGFVDGKPYKSGDIVPENWNKVELHVSGTGDDWLLIDGSKKKKNLGLIFTFSKKAKVSGLVLWNYNADGDWARRGVNEVDLYVSSDGGLNWKLAETIRPKNANGIKPEAGQVFMFAKGSYNVDAIKLIGRSTNPTGGQHGLNEILFIEDTSVSPINAEPNIPSPVDRTTTFSNSVGALSWQAPVDKKIASIDGYKVYFGQKTKVTDNPVYQVYGQTLPVKLESGKKYYWRVDTKITRSQGKKETIRGKLWSFRTLPERTVKNLNPDPSWYVGDTTPGEWIEYKDVYLSEGHYRFTGHLGAEREGQNVTISIDGGSLGLIDVPATGGYENFELVHLGSKFVKTGRYTIRLTFNTGQISADMIYIRKSADTGSQVVDDDIASPAPAKADGTAVAPISSRTKRGRWPFGQNGYTDKQNLAWFKQRMYTPMLNDDLLYSKLDEQIAARVDFAWLEGMGTNIEDLPDRDWGYDRDYIAENGDNGAGKNVRFFETLDEHPFAGYLQFGYFVGNSIYGETYKKNTGKKADWASKDFQEWIWLHWTKPWFDTVPAKRLYLEDNHVLVNFATPNCGCGNKAGISAFMKDFKARIKKQYGYDTHIILASGFINADPKLINIAYAQQPWLTWDMDDNYDHSTVNGVTTSIVANGRRKTLSSVWKNDWDPLSNTGTRQGQQYDDDGNYSPTHVGGRSEYLRGLKQANEKGSKWIMLNRWDEALEGSSWFRTEHHDNDYPNEFINITRQFSDRDTSAVLLQAEGADYYYDSTPGNSGGAYRYYWHEGRESDLDVFRPRRKLHGFKTFANVPTGLTSLTGGEYDIWGLNERGLPFATEKDGNDVWQRALNEDQNRLKLKFKQVEVGQHGWAISKGNVYRSGFSQGNKPWENRHWQLMKKNADFIDLSLNIYQNQVWAVDNRQRIWMANQSVGTFSRIKGPKIVNIAAGEDWVWGIMPDGRLVRRSIRNETEWEKVKSPIVFSEIETGSGELWGITKDGHAYRNSEHGKGKWQHISADVKSVALASEFVWLLKADGTVLWSKMTGFQEIR